MTMPENAFFQKHMGYLMSGDLDGLLKDQYHPDAMLISPFDVLPNAKPPHVLENGPKLKEFFQAWLKSNDHMQLESLYDFVELDDSIFFQAIINGDAGRFVLGEAWHMRGDKIDRHYGFCHKLD